MQFIDHFLVQDPINFPASSSFLTNTKDITQRSLCDQQHTRDQDQEDQQKSGNWMSSKMRIMRKMMNPDGIVTKKPRRSKHLLPDHQNQQPSQASSNSDGIVRVCSDCNTTKTPLWRSGPCGPKVYIPFENLLCSYYPFYIVSDRFLGSSLRSNATRLLYN